MAKLFIGNIKVLIECGPLMIYLRAPHYYDISCDEVLPGFLRVGWKGRPLWSLGKSTKRCC